MKHASDEAGCELHPNKGAALRLPVFHMGFNGITRMFQSSILVGHWSTRSVNHDLHSILQSLKNSHFSNFKLRSSTKVQTLTVKGHVSISISWLGKLVPRLLHQALADYKFSSPNIVESKSKALLPLGLSQLGVSVRHSLSNCGEQGASWVWYWPCHLRKKTRTFIYTSGEVSHCLNLPDLIISCFTCLWPCRT